MAREIVAWCDRHLHLKQEHVPATEVRVGLDRQWWSADLCAGCAGDLMDPVAHLLSQHGQVVKVDSLPARAPAPAALRDTRGIEKLPPSDVTPPHSDSERLHETLRQRRQGTRRGRRPSADAEAAQLPCIFCGLYLKDGGNTAHARVHGFSNMSRALGNLCPWCGDLYEGLGAHISRTHPEEVAVTPVQMVRIFLDAHLQKAPFDQLHAIRARAFNTEPLGAILQGWTRA